MAANLRASSLFQIGGQVVLLTLGAVISALGVIVFEAPFKIAAGGISGLAIILNSVIHTPIGLVILIGNIPVQLLAYRMLGGWRVIAATIYAVALYSILVDVLPPYVHTISSDRLLDAVFGGIVSGIGAALVLRAGGTMGGTSTLGRILQQRFGTPLSSSTLYLDGIVVLAAGLAFGWEGALYAMVGLYVAGATTDYALEGPSVIRTGVIITDHPKEVAARIMHDLGRGVTGWDAKGMFTEQPHTVLYVAISRGQVSALQHIVMAVDPAAFLVIGEAHTAYGEGFKEVRREKE